MYSTILAVVQFFTKYYSCPGCTGAAALLYLLLVLLTVFCGLRTHRIRFTPYFNGRVRELISDFALVIGVLIASFFGSYVFSAVPLPPFTYNPNGRMFTFVDLLDCPVWCIFACAGFGLILAILLSVDHVISSAMAQTPSMLLQKGSAYHWDLILAGVLCAFSSLFGLPWVNASIPHSPMHALSLADREETHLSDGSSHVRVTYARETRVAVVAANLLIGLCLFALPMPLQLIPVPVLYGVFLFMAVTSLETNSFWSRLLLVITQQSRYPLRLFIQRVPQRWIHGFTGIQAAFLIIMCVIAFVPQTFVNLLFPLFLLGLVGFRHLVFPLFFPHPYLVELDRPPA